jgi:hypothetical protein
MAGIINPKEKYYCGYCDTYFRLYYSWARHKCPNQKFIDDDKVVTEKELETFKYYH